MKFKDRTTRISDMDRILGEPRGAILYMAVIMMIPLLVSYLNAFVDTMWVSDLGGDAVSAVSVIYPLYCIISSIGIGFGIGTSTCLSYHIGRKDRDRAELIATSSLMMGVVISLGISVFLLLFVGPIVVIMGAESIKDLAVAYMFPFSICAAILVGYSILINLMKGEGAVRKVLASGVLCAGLNIVLDPILIFTLDLGIAGAAWATSLSTMCSILLIYYWYFSGKMYIKLKLLRRPDPGCIKEVMSVGAPRSAEEMLSGIFLLIQRVVFLAVAGSVSLMMHSLAFTYFNLLLVVSMSIGSATMTVGSVGVGQGDREKLMRGVRFSIYLTLGVSVAASIILMICVEPFMSIFMTAGIEEHAADITWATIMYLIMLPFYSLRTLSRYLLQIIRKSKMSAALTLYTNILKTIFYFLPFMIGMLTFEGTVWSAFMGYVLSSVIIFGITVNEFRKFGDADFKRIAAVSEANP